MVVGFDISTLRIDWAWVSDGGYPMCSNVQLGFPDMHVIDRIRNIVNLGLPYQMTEACIEMPFSVNRDTNAKLMAVLGALTTRIDRTARVSWISCGDLRAAIGAKNSKDEAQAHLNTRFPGELDDWDEHELDALCACMGWTNILNLQEEIE